MAESECLVLFVHTPRSAHGSAFSMNFNYVGTGGVQSLSILSNVKIRVEADVTFTLDGSKFFCCQNMWQGIDLDYQSTIVSRNMTEIEDAVVAIESPCTATLSVRNSVFNRNMVGIRLGYDGPIPTDPCHNFPAFTQFSGNTFQCTAPLNGTTDGVTFVGVQVYKTNATIGAISSALNTFRNLQFGIRFEAQWWGTSVVNRCNFERVLNDGIFMEQGNLRVDRCTFLNNGFRGINILSTRGLVVRKSDFDYNDDVAAQINGANIYRHIQAANFGPNCSVNINQNTFDGAFADTGKVENLRGIELIGDATMGGGTNIRIYGNEFSCSVIQADFGFSSDIFLTGEFPSNTSTVIEFNNFFLDQPSDDFPTASVSVIAITLINGNKNQVQIYSNTFDSDAWGPLSFAAGDWGINLFGSMGGGNVVTGNTFTFNPNTGYSVNFFSGIYTLDFTNTLFCANDLRECTYPMYFQGTSMGTQYFANIHTGGSHSFRVDDGFIGEQGKEGGIHHGNKWYDKWLNIFPLEHAFHLQPQQAINSRFWVHTPQSVRDTASYTYFSEFHPAFIDPDQMDEWFREDPAGFPGSGDCLDHFSVSTETDRAIAGGTIDMTGLSDAHAWTSRRYLYAKLMQNLGLRDDYSEFGPFLSNEAQTSVGQLYAVEQKIAEGLQLTAGTEAQLSQIKADEALAVEALLLADSVLNTATDAAALASAVSDKNAALATLRTLDSLYGEINTTHRAAMMVKLQEALALNDAVIASTNYEQYEKTVNDIDIRQTLIQNGALTAAQIDTLNNIASQCPKYGGHGVHRARGLLTGCNAGYWSDNYTGCYPVAPHLGEQVANNGFEERSASKQLPLQILAFPNPATEGIYVRVFTGTYGQITLQDMTGKTWREARFAPDDEVTYLDLEAVPAGMYSCIVSGVNGERQAIKVFVVKH